jgi:hypothetical protein
MKHILAIAVSALALCGCAAKGNYNNYVDNNYGSYCRMATPLPGSRLGPTCNASSPSGFDIATAGEMAPAPSAGIH